MALLIRVVAVLIWTVCLYGILGGAFVYRENLSSGLYNSYTLTMYKTLPLAPLGAAYCNFLELGVAALAGPCDFKPPFIGWLQGGRYQPNTARPFCNVTLSCARSLSASG
jgi:hypothetical protein